MRSKPEGRADWSGRLCWALAVLTGANALWMLLQPATWFTDLPAAVPDFGAYNEHFVRDIGCAFAAVALAFGLAARRPGSRPALLAVAACFLVAHALLHVFDTTRGAVGPEHWWIDLPGVYLPAGLSLALLLHARETARAGSPDTPQR